MINNNITLEEDYNKILNEKLDSKFNYFFKKNKNYRYRYLLLNIMRYFKFDDLNNQLQKFIIRNINELCYCNNDNKNSNNKDNEFLSNNLFDLSINFILEGNINFNNKKNLLYESLSKSKFYKNYEQLNNLNNNEELSTIFKIFNF